MKKKIIIKLLAIVVFAIGMTCLNETNTIKTSAEALSNKLIGWGIKRNDNHEQPDLGKTNKELIEKYKGMCLGSKENKYVYITFDSGYEAGYTSKILEALKQNQVSATFFLTAHYINTQPELVQQMIDEGHIIGNHAPNCLMSGIEKI